MYLSPGDDVRKLFLRDLCCFFSRVHDSDCDQLGGEKSELPVVASMDLLSSVQVHLMKTKSTAAIIDLAAYDVQPSALDKLPSLLRPSLRWSKKSEIK